MARNIVAGIDVGTHHVRIVVGERVTKGSKSATRVIGMGIAGSKGLRYGYIINSSETLKSIREALQRAEHASGVKIKSAYLSMGGVSLEGISSSGSVVTSRADAKITEHDVESAMESAEESLSKPASQNRRVLHTVPMQFKIDGKEVLGRPAGMQGVKLEVKTLLITCLEQHLKDLIQVVEEAGIEVEDVVASPLAAGLVNLTKAQRIAGVVLANVGAETVSVVIYENNIPISLKVFPIGSTDITNDIALGLKVPLDEAEAIKLGETNTTSYSQKKLDEIVSARLTDILELIQAQLKKINKDELLPAGIVLTGGGSGIATIEDLAKASLSLPSKTADLTITTSKGNIGDPSWSVSYGLAKLGLATPGENPQGFTMARHTKDNVLGWVKKFLP